MIETIITGGKYPKPKQANFITDDIKNLVYHSHLNTLTFQWELPKINGQK